MFLALKLPQNCFIMNIRLLTLPQSQSSQSDKIWKQGNFKNPNFPTVSWIGRYLAKYKANIQKSQFSISSINWEKLRSPARATFKNPNFQFQVFPNSQNELGKTWKYSLRPRFKSQFWIYWWIRKSYVLI